MSVAMRISSSRSRMRSGKRSMGVVRESGRARPYPPPLPPPQGGRGKKPVRGAPSPLEREGWGGGSRAWEASQSLLRRALARLLVDFLDQVLADARGHLLMDVEQALAPLRLLLRRERVEIDAGLLDLGERVSVLFLGDRVAVLRRILDGAVQRPADIGRQAFPEFFVH